MNVEKITRLAVNNCIHQIASHSTEFLTSIRCGRIFTWNLLTTNYQHILFENGKTFRTFILKILTVAKCYLDHCA